MAIPSSQAIRSESKIMVPELRPVMPVDLYLAAIKGNSDVLIQRLGLQPEKPMEIQEDRDSDRKILLCTKDLPFGFELAPPIRTTSPFATRPKETIETSHSALQQIKTEHQTIQSELQSATHFGDTLLHLLVTKRHNELASKVFKRDLSLLKAQNKMLETPLHSTAKVGNYEVIQMLIRIDPAVVKDVLQESNERGDTALHVAVRYNFKSISIELMKLNPKVAYKANHKMFTPLYVAIEENRNSIVENMIEVDRNLACTQFFNGMFPVHLAARKRNMRLVRHFVDNYPDYAELVDPIGRNFFHFAFEEGGDFIYFYLKSSRKGDMEARMINAMDYEGNTPLHIAAMKGHSTTMKDIWEMICGAETARNKQGLTPYEVSKRQLLENSNEDSKRMDSRIRTYERTNGAKFSKEWFDQVMVPPSFLNIYVTDVPVKENTWERNQLIGLGSVLITTVTFAAAFTMPGGYNQDNGTPVLGRRYMFWAFILANTLAFIQGFLSLFALLINALPGVPTDHTLKFATIFCLLAATTLVVTFGLGLYVTLAPLCLPIAIIILAITLFIGSPALLLIFITRETYIDIVTIILSSRRSILAIYAVSLLFIFCLALLSR